ncbi:hypothetical protein V6N13_013923 [Hibiscus sabdariffa]
MMEGTITREGGADAAMASPPALTENVRNQTIACIRFIRIGILATIGLQTYGSQPLTGPLYNGGQPARLRFVSNRTPSHMNKKNKVKAPIRPFKSVKETHT